MPIRPSKFSFELRRPHETLGVSKAFNHNSEAMKKPLVTLESVELEKITG